MSLNSDYKYKYILSLEKSHCELSLLVYCFKLVLNIKSIDDYYKILSAQWLIINKYKKGEEFLLLFINKNKDINRIADASDILLEYGSENSKKLALNKLNKLGGKTINIYNNEQNVHKITESLVKQVEHLLSLTSKIHDLNEVIDEIKKIKNNEQIEFALNRILLDKTKFEKYNCTLGLILIKLWTFISNHESRFELTKRLCEELGEMANTCSSGFLKRLINTMSGYDDFNLSISWEDQIIANFIGRINSKIKNICDIDSIFRNEKTILELKKKFLNDNEEEVLKLYQENVLNEITEENLTKKQNTFLFFRTWFITIKNELYEEFKTYISDTDFELIMRKAIFTFGGF